MSTKGGKKYAEAVRRFDRENLHSPGEAVDLAQPLEPFVTPVHVTSERFGSVPRFYVRCLQVHAVVPALQERMLAASPCQTVVVSVVAVWSYWYSVSV